MDKAESFNNCARAEAKSQRGSSSSSSSSSSNSSNSLSSKSDTFSGGAIVFHESRREKGKRKQEGVVFKGSALEEIENFVFSDEDEGDKIEYTNVPLSTNKKNLLATSGKNLSYISSLPNNIKNVFGSPAPKTVSSSSGGVAGSCSSSLYSSDSSSSFSGPVRSFLGPLDSNSGISMTEHLSTTEGKGGPGIWGYSSGELWEQQDTGCQFGTGPGRLV